MEMSGLWFIYFCVFKIFFLLSKRKIKYLKKAQKSHFTNVFVDYGE